MKMPGPHQTADEQAAFWFLRLQDDNVEPEEIEAALAWQEECPGNRDAMARVQRAWRLADHMPTPAHIPILRQSVWRPASGVAALAAAAAIGVVLIISWRAWIAEHPVPATLVAVGTPEAQPTSTQAGHPEDGYRYASNPGENRTIALQDGSEVVLGGASVISVSYSPGTRRVNLVAGEAFFSVAKDAARPFVVDAGDGETQAVGTQFDVHRGVDAVTVTVIEGVVRVSAKTSTTATASAQSATQLAAGHQVSYSPKGPIGPIKPAAVERAASWRDGELTFVDRSLAYVVVDLNRYSSRPIEIHDEAVKAIRITGMVTVAKMDDWLQALEKDLPIQLVATKDALLLAKKSGTPKN